MDGHREAEAGTSDDYEQDILAWSRHQGALLRRIASGEAVNETLDWDNIAEEIETVGRNELRAVRSLLIQALVHMLKAEGWPQARDVPSWRADAVGFRQDARDAFTPSMRQHLDVDDLYRRAVRRLPARMDGKPPQVLPDSCPMTLDELLGE
jgi:hypothetical protein